MSLFPFLPFGLADDAPTLPYTQDFEKLPEGELPEQIQVLEGEFTIKKIGGNTLLHMAGDPLKPNGILLGPADKNAYQVSARIKTSATGKLLPEFGIGACGPNQFKLWLMPAVGELQILSGEDVDAKVPYRWTSGTWTKLKLRVSQSGGKFKVEGKAWPEGGEEPKGWMISYDAPEAPRPGRAGVYVTPYSGAAAEIDDIVIEP